MLFHYGKHKLKTITEMSLQKNNVNYRIQFFFIKTVLSNASRTVRFKLDTVTFDTRRLNGQK